jgi:phage baseplate assembly protein gpV
MVAEEYNNQAGVYKVQTFGTTQFNAAAESIYIAEAKSVLSVF